MTGPEHYREAERLLAEEVFITPHGTVTRSFEETVAAAQVHATLALAAATALNMPHPHGGMEHADSLAWFKAASVNRKR